MRRFVLLCTLVAPAHGRPPQRPAALAARVDDAPECAKCGQMAEARQGTAAGPNCCNAGGTWEGMCDEGGQHTWHEGFVACKSPAHAGDALTQPPALPRAPTASCNPGDWNCEQAARLSPPEPSPVAHEASGDQPAAAEAVSEVKPTTSVSCNGDWKCEEAARRSQRGPKAPSLEAGGRQPAAAEAAAEANTTMTRWSSPEVLSNVFLKGMPSNDLRKVGLLFHGFDQTEDSWAPYKPCTTGFCAQFADWWPTSIINARQTHTFGVSGILFTPTLNAVLCSYYEDAGTMGEGDGGMACDAKSGKMYPPDQLDSMLNVSMGLSRSAYGSGYNEVLLDSRMFLENLPRSIAAFVYGLRGDDGGDQALRAYVRFLAAYNLSEADVPLVSANLDSFEPGMAPEPGPVFTDVSTRARPFLQQPGTYEVDRLRWRPNQDQGREKADGGGRQRTTWEERAPAREAARQQRIEEREQQRAEAEAQPQGLPGGDVLTFPSGEGAPRPHR